MKNVLGLFGGRFYDILLCKSDFDIGVMRKEVP